MTLTYHIPFRSIYRSEPDIVSFDNSIDVACVCGFLVRKLQGGALFVKLVNITIMSLLGFMVDIC